MTNPVPSEPQQREPDHRERRSSKRVLLMALAAVVLGGAWQSYRWFTTPRASVDRLVVQTMLRGVAQAYMEYRAAHGDWPTFEQMAQRGALTAAQTDFFATVAYKGATTAGEPRMVVVQKCPCRAVRKGEPWGGPGEVTDRDLPACRYALFEDMRVRGMDEEEFQTRYIPLIDVVTYP